MTSTILPYLWRAFTERRRSYSNLMAHREKAKSVNGSTCHQSCSWIHWRNRRSTTRAKGRNFCMATMRRLNIWIKDWLWIIMSVKSGLNWRKQSLMDRSKRKKWSLKTKSVKNMLSFKQMKMSLAFWVKDCHQSSPKAISHNSHKPSKSSLSATKKIDLWMNKTKLTRL